jgi:hypothetical protein
MSWFSTRVFLGIAPMLLGAAAHAQVVDEPPVGISATPTMVLSPPAHTGITIAGRHVNIKYSSPSMRKRVIFGELVPYGKVWRAGANDATALQTDADLQIGDLKIPSGNYTLFVWPTETQWLLIVNKQTGQSGLEYHPERDLGRVTMTLSKAPKTLEHYKMALSKTGPDSGHLELSWENTVAGVNFQVLNPK